MNRFLSFPKLNAVITPAAVIHPHTAVADQKLTFQFHFYYCTVSAPQMIQRRLRDLSAGADNFIRNTALYPK